MTNPRPHVVLVAYYFDWDYSVGSRRARGLATYLPERGFDITVISARSPHPHLAGQHLPAGVKVICTGPADRVLTFRRALSRLRRRRVPASRSTASAQPDGNSSAGGRKSNSLLRTLALFPDSMWEWQYTARRAGRRLTAVDVVVATVPPVAALRLGKWLAARHSAPLIADFRDLWSDDPERSFPTLIQQLDKLLERRTLDAAAHVVTVAEPLSALVRSKVAVPISTIPNGIDPIWLEERRSDPYRPSDGVATYSIVHTGALNRSTGRDPGMLLDALRQVKDEDGTHWTLHLYGSVSLDVVDPLNQFADLIELHGSVSAAHARSAQRHADVLLSLAWESPLDAAALPAKLFEYAAAGRVVLHTGLEESLGTAFIRHERLGVLCPTRESIVRVLRDYANGTLSWEPPELASLERHLLTERADRYAEVLRAVLISPFGAAESKGSH